MLSELSGEDGAERRDADAAADGPEERRSAGSSAEVAVLHRVLYREDQHLHHHAQPHAEHEHIQTRCGDAGVFVHQREEKQANRETAAAQNRKELVPSRPANDLTAGE